MLKKGDKIALVAPSGCFHKDDLNNGLNFFQNIGLKPCVAKHAYETFYYAAGTPEHRADDINQAFKDHQIKAIFCIRGGAGSSQILDFLDYEMIKKNKKPVFGLSDSTALQNALYTKTGNVSYTGFLPIYDFREGPLNQKLEKSFQDVLSGKKISYNEFDVLNEGIMEGVVVGGCLSVFNMLCGTPYFPNLNNKILLIEDVGEKTYQLDLKLQQLKMQKGFNNIQGIIFGTFLNCVEADENDGSVDDIIQNFSKNIDKPVVCHFPYGHMKERILMPIGKKIKISAKR